MPRIKFSTLASAMAGKSNGSVFAKNNGGYYFRNNKSGFSLKSAKQSLAQSKFKAVSGQWRNLSLAQQQAWNDATSSFPTLDIFGDSKPRTGYNLYCQLNGALQLRDLPAINVPPLPNPLPSVTNSVWQTSDDFLYQPAYGFSNAQWPNTYDTFTMRAILDGSPRILDSKYAVMLAVDFLTLEKSLLNDSIEFRSTIGSVNFTEYISLSGTYGDPAHFGVLAEINSGGYNVVTDFLIPKSAFTESNIMVLQYQDLDPDRFSLYVNGTWYSAITSTVTGTIEPVSAQVLELDLIRPSLNTSYIIKDYRVLTGYNLPFDIAGALMGYQSNFDTLMFQFPLYKGDVIRGYVLNQEDMSVSVLQDGNVIPIEHSTFPVTSYRFPLINVSFTIVNQANWLLELLTSPPVSAGRSFRSASYKPVPVLGVDWSVANDLQNNFQNTLGFIPANSTLNLMYRFFDPTSGVVSRPQLVEAKNPSRFKAGSELSGKVNK